MLLLNKIHVIIIVNIFVIQIVSFKSDNIKCNKDENVCYKIDNKNYLLYDLNNVEGFNLRRDVYIRVANLVKSLRSDGDDWILVLPPWSNVNHWHHQQIKQNRLNWSLFFDIQSLQKYIPVIEFKTFILETNKNWKIDQILYLQDFKESWTNGEWQEKFNLSDCHLIPEYTRDSNLNYNGFFWGFGNKMNAYNLTCVTFQGTISLMKKLLKLFDFQSKSVFIDRAEVMLHENYGQKEYWKCRRSMRFAKHLITEANQFRLEFLDSNDERDKTMLDEDWTIMKRNHGDALGGPYLAVHLRRGDFLVARPNSVPTIPFVAKTLRRLLEKLNLKTIFLSTDADYDDKQELKNILKDIKVISYEATKERIEKFKDGGLAIIDQWICAHAKWFIGSHESTFSFRIQEEREILGFNPETTFNRLCSDNEGSSCEQPAKWTIKLMANTNRSPKELRDLIERSKRENDYAEIEQTMQKLRNLSEDDKTETGLLRARIEEQSRLIMILKQRGDDFIRKNMSLEKLNKELIEEKEQTQHDTINLKKKCELLNTRFNELAENHQEIIKIKDEYKNSNQILREENEKLQLILNNYSKNEYAKEKKYLDEIAILNDLCMKQEKEIEGLKDHLEKTKLSYEENVNEIKHESEKKITKLEAELSINKKENEDLNKLIKQYEYDLSNMMNTCDMKLKDIRKERDELIELNVQRAKVIQEKQVENQILANRINEMEKVVASLKEKYELEYEKVNTNSTIQKLRRELSEMEVKKNEISMEYESFKKHSLSLLEREKELNSKLRFLVH